jgi:hypothetical protein
MSNRTARIAGSLSAHGSAGSGSSKSISEFHRRRAESEMSRALSAGPLSVAIRHLELARLHRERRSALHLQEPPPECTAIVIDRTDKEG